MSKDRNGPWTPQQSMTLFKWTRRDFRNDINSRKITYGDLYDLIGQVITVAKAQTDRATGYAAGRNETERLLANFPPA